MLDVSSNRLVKVEGLDAQTILEDLWLNDNQLDEWDGLYESLEGPRQTLSTIYLENNPIVRIVGYPTPLSRSINVCRQGIRITRHVSVQCYQS